MWDVKLDEHTSPFIYKRFIELYNAGKKIDFGDITNEEFVGLVRPENEKETCNEVKKSKKNKSDEEEDEDDEDEDEDDEEEEKTEDKDHEQDEDFQIEAFTEYFDNITKAGKFKEFKFGREGYGIDQLGDVNFMMSFRSV
jgi:ABC-type Zn2+ transport system substrate-binding protein/surface adhesin